MKEERMAILRMLENGTISADEAERLLNALQNTASKSGVSESINNILSKTGSVLEDLAHTIGKKAGSAAKIVGEKAEEAKPEIKKAASTVKEKVSEAASSIKEEIKNRKSADVTDDDFEDDAVEDIDLNEAPEADAEAGEATAAEEDASEEVCEEKADETEANIFGFAGFSPTELTDEMAAEYEENRDYEAEFNKMMKECNGDIFGEVLNPINDELFKAQQEWEEMKRNGDGVEE